MKYFLPWIIIVVIPLSIIAYGVHSHEKDGERKAQSEDGRECNSMPIMVGKMITIIVTCKENSPQ
jgi:hypothetical protein